ncbi:MAG TPA: M28 family peptidase [Gemmatimonadales bacterium]|nr:M28 family peptidase [Gemmatimonadales bacterium]
MTDYEVLFHELAIPRLVGTSNHQKVREILKRELRARGFTIEEHVFSGRPSRAFVGSPRHVNGINLIAHGPTVRPSVWLVAHYDSKGQPISMALRLIGFGALLLGVLALLIAIVPAIVILAFGLIIVSQNRINDNSPGALDNASAVVAIFMAIDQLSARNAVGVIFPDAEEFGLVGARALAADRADLLADSAVINLDGLDDAGRATAFMHRPGKLMAAVAAAVNARTWRWLPVIVDGIALAQVSRECVTIMKGGWRTMCVVHRPVDGVARLRLDGAASVAAGLARVLRGF